MSLEEGQPDNAAHQSDCVTRRIDFRNRSIHTVARRSRISSVLLPSKPERHSIGKGEGTCVNDVPLLEGPATGVRTSLTILWFAEVDLYVIQEWIVFVVRGVFQGQC